MTKLWHMRAVRTCAWLCYISHIVHTQMPTHSNLAVYGLTYRCTLFFLFFSRCFFLNKNQNNPPPPSPQKHTHLLQLFSRRTHTPRSHIYTHTPTHMNSPSEYAHAQSHTRTRSRPYSAQIPHVGVDATRRHEEGHAQPGEDRESAGRHQY